MISSIQGLKTFKVDLEEFLNFVAPEEELKKVILVLSHIAEKRKEFLYFAGGVVRDYIYYKKRGINKKQGLKDLDVVLQGNLDEFLKEFLNIIKGRIIFKSQFLTYKVGLTLKHKEVLIDFITARKEKYKGIAQLPEVMPSHFKEDILRRDFTINTFIIGLSSPYKACLIDMVGGLRDLEDGIIKPLHLNSFVEDPTRIFRGIRYKVRFNFKFSEEFFEALRRSFEKEALKSLTPARIVNELKLFLNKESRTDLKELLITTQSIGVFERAGIKINKNLELLVEVLEEVETELDNREKEKAFLLGLIDFSFIECAKILDFSEKTIKRLKKHLKDFLALYKDWKNLNIDEKILFLDKLPLYFLLGLIVNFPDTKDDILKYLKVYSKIKPKLTGRDLKKLGIKEGKRIGEVLRLLRLKKIRGELKNKEDEIEFVKEFLLMK